MQYLKKNIIYINLSLEFFLLFENFLSSCFSVLVGIISQFLLVLFLGSCWSYLSALVGLVSRFLLVLFLEKNIATIDHKSNLIFSFLLNSNEIYRAWLVLKA